jgi:hypothetical protein
MNGGVMRKTVQFCTASILALMLGTGAFAQTAPDVSRAEALAGAIAGSEDGQRAIERYLDSGGLPEAAAQRAVALIRELQRSDLVADPLVLAAAADRVSSAASRSFISARIFKAKVTTSFELGEGRYGFDFGPPDAKVTPGFTKVTARSDFVKGPKPAAMRRPEGDALLRDGIRNLRVIRLPVPSGKYRVFLMTDDIGVPEAVTSPFGEAMKVNGRRVRVAASTPDTWAGETYLAEPGRYLQDGEQADAVSRRGNARGASSGGVVMMSAVVENNELVITFDGQAGLETYLTGVIIEPEAMEESIFAPSAEARRVLFAGQDQLLAAENQVNQAVAQLLNDVATSAQPQQLAALLDQPEPVVEPALDVSPN